MDNTMMQSKHILVFCYIGSVAFCLPIDILKKIEDYEVTIEYLHVCDELIRAKTFSEIVKIYPDLQRYNFSEFSIIMFLVCENKPSAKNIIIAPSIVSELSTMIDRAENKKSPSTRIIGANPSLEGEKLKDQIDIFNGRFIFTIQSLAQFRRDIERFYNE